MLLAEELTTVVEDALELLALRRLLVEDRFRRRAQGFEDVGGEHRELLAHSSRTPAS